MNFPLVSVKLRVTSTVEAPMELAAVRLAFVEPEIMRSRPTFSLNFCAALVSDRRKVVVEAPLTRKSRLSTLIAPGRLIVPAPVEPKTAPSPAALFQGCPSQFRLDVRQRQYSFGGAGDPIPVECPLVAERRCSGRHDLESRRPSDNRSAIPDPTRSRRERRPFQS